MSVTWLDDRLAGVRAASLRARLVGTGLLLLVVGAVAGLTWWAWDAGHLDTREVVVTGTQRIPAEQVHDVAAVAIGTPLVAVDVGAVADEVGAMPLVLDVRVERRWPRTLAVEVTERVAVAALPTPGGFEVVDAEGVVLESGPTPPEGVPVLRVDVERDGTDTLAAARAVLDSLPEDMSDRVGEVSATSPADVRLVVDGKQVRWGTAEESGRKLRVLLGLMGSVEGSVYDVSSPRAPAVTP